MAKIRIILADDHTLFRQAIRTLISAEPDMEVVGEASNGSDAVDKANEARPDVVLMDIGMPGLSSFEATVPPGGCNPRPHFQRRLVALDTWFAGTLREDRREVAVECMLLLRSARGG